MSDPIEIDTDEDPTPTRTRHRRGPDSDEAATSKAVTELARALVGWNERVAPPEKFSPLAVFARREGVLVGGVAGRTHCGWLFRQPSVDRR